MQDTTGTAAQIIEVIDHDPDTGQPVWVLGDRAYPVCVCADFGATGSHQRHTRCMAHGEATR